MERSIVFISVFVALVLSAALYALFAYVYYRIGRKFGIGSLGKYCIPVYNSILLCRCAEISPWHTLWLLVPVGGLAFVVYLFGTLAEKLGHSFWPFGLGMLLFSIPAFILAFDDSKPVGRKTITMAIQPTICCMSGEFAGNRLPVSTTGFVIGRSAASSNLVLSYADVSASHVRVWADPEGRLWLQDLGSSNGTYYCEPRTGVPEVWIELKTPVVLTSGMHFRLGENAAEFMVS
jgi:hypothetical protein